jgi:choline dehydrogenase-like flavoprotein
VLEELNFPINGGIAGNHHMGGTRMTSSPIDGVVNKNCKAFSQQNLYILGLSTFPTSGHANPTLTII